MHKSSFELEHKRTSTTLSERLEIKKNKNINFNIKWEIVKKVKPFAPNDNVCKLCLQEKLSILRSAPSLNKRSENFWTLFHRKKNSCLTILTSQCQLSLSPLSPKLCAPFPPSPSLSFGISLSVSLGLLHYLSDLQPSTTY